MFSRKTIRKNIYYREKKRQILTLKNYFDLSIMLTVFGRSIEWRNPDYCEFFKYNNRMRCKDGTRLFKDLANCCKIRLTFPLWINTDFVWNIPYHHFKNFMLCNDCCMITPNYFLLLFTNWQVAVLQQSCPCTNLTDTK